MGARPDCDGLSTTAFPSGVGSVPVEIAESVAPLIYERKQFVPDSGGAGRQRGGLGQEIVLCAARGEAMISDGRRVTDKGLYRIATGDRITLRTPGGGGFGDPTERDPALLARDLTQGLISAEAASTLYGSCKQPPSSSTSTVQSNTTATHTMQTDKAPTVIPPTDNPRRDPP